MGCGTSSPTEGAKTRKHHGKDTKVFSKMSSGSGKPANPEADFFSADGGYYEPQPQDAAPPLVAGADGSALPPPPSYEESQHHPNSNGAPLKYIKGVDGVRRLNPRYLFHQTQQQERLGNGVPGNGTTARGAVTTTSVLYPGTSLPICSNMEEFMLYSPDTPLPPKTDAAIETMQSEGGTKNGTLGYTAPGFHPAPNVAVGIATGDQMIDELGRILAKYEAPIGMMPKLLELQTFDLLEFIIDDSGSMRENSDVRVRMGGPFLTRWEEVRSRMEALFELLSCVPSPPISIVFLNRSDQILLRQPTIGEKPLSPAQFLADAKQELSRVWYTNAYGRTPALKSIKRSFDQHKGKKVVRYFFGDGEPNGGVEEERQISDLLRYRPHPELSPFTFMSCTDNDDQTEWMKDVEEVAPYCAEYDDFRDEATEVSRDHGAAFPYSLGLHLVGQLVGAMNSHDLDALDDSVPLPKKILDELLGSTHSEKEYRHYFTGFMIAQKQREVKTPADLVRKSVQWDDWYREFLKAPSSNDIKAVKEYRRRLAKV